MATTYAEKLKDPRWQKKRLEVLSKNNFTCEMCGNGEETLHVHHKEYFKNREPWEYDTKQLACICATCHKNEHHEEDSLKLVSSFLSIDGPKSRDSVASLIAGFAGFDMDMLKQSNTSEMVAAPKNRHVTLLQHHRKE